MLLNFLELLENFNKEYSGLFLVYSFDTAVKEYIPFFVHHREGHIMLSWNPQKPSPQIMSMPREYLEQFISNQLERNPGRMEWNSRSRKVESPGGEVTMGHQIICTRIEREIYS